MSIYCIPLDIQEEIIKRLPVKSVIRLTSVSKQWKSLIMNSKFISNYHICNIQPHHLLISYEKSNYEQISVVDDDTFPKQQFSLTLPAYPHEKLVLVGGSSQGLLCFFYYTRSYKNQQDLILKKIAVIWNPTIRKSVDIVMPNVLDKYSYNTVVGFGVLPHTGDPMLVQIKYINDISKTNVTEIPWQVEVFTLSSGDWRSPSINLPRKSIKFRSHHVVVNEFIYWSASDRYFVDGVLHSHCIIMSFNMTSEEFTELHLPDSLTSRTYDLSVSKLKESLVVVQNKYCSGLVNIWMMHNDDPKSLAMIYTINTPGIWIRNVRGFRENGEFFFEITDNKEETPLFVYEPNSRRISDFGISGRPSSLRVISYMETLLLLDYKDCRV